jgi:hypothetical protein
MSRRTALILAAIATLALGVVEVEVDPHARDSGDPSIVDFEFAGTQDRVDEIRADWGESGLDAAKRSLWIDYAYIVAYGTFLVLAAATTRDLAERRGWDRMASMGLLVMTFAAAAAAFDAIEDVGLLLAVNQHGGALAPRLAQVCTILKFTLLAVTIAYLLTGLALRFRRRPA